LRDAVVKLEGSVEEKVHLVVRERGAWMWRSGRWNKVKELWAD